MTDMPTELISAAYYRGNRTFALERVRPVQPGPGEVAIRGAYCGICGTDLHVFHGHMDSRVGLNRILGHEMSGTVVAVGDGVEVPAVGQRVVVRPLDHCGNCPACHAGHTHICHNLLFLGLDSNGAMQEIWTVPVHTVHFLPDGVRLDHAALIEPVAVACHDVRLSGLQPGEDVVVIGGGPIGMLVAMVARQAGGKVIVSEVSPGRLSIAEKLGFDTVNPVTDNLAGIVDTNTGGKGADIVFEVSGSQAGVDATTAVVATRGRIVMVAIHPVPPKVNMFQYFWRELKLIGVRVYEPEDFEKAISTVSAGFIDADAIITDISPLEDVQSAFEALDSNPSALKNLLRIGDSV